MHRFIFSWIKHEFIAIDCVKLHFSSLLSNLNTGFKNSHFFTPWRWSKARFQKDKKWNETPHLHIFSEHIQSTYFFSLLFCEILDLFCTISGTRPHTFSQRQPDWMWSVCPWTVSFRFLHYFFSRLPHILKPSNCDQLPITCGKSLCGIQRRSGRCASWYWIPLHFIFEIHSNIH